MQNIQIQDRPSWDNYFMEIAHVVAKRSTCIRRQVGAVITKKNRIIATGYNGAPPGLDHCLDIGCFRQENNIPSGERMELCRATHAEQNALLVSAQNGFDTVGAVLYVTAQPCSTCAKLIVTSHIERVVYQGEYPDKLTMEILRKAGVKLVQVPSMEKQAMAEIAASRPAVNNNPLVKNISLPRLNRLTPTLESTMLKLTEEAGELSQAIGKMRGLSGEVSTRVPEEQALEAISKELLDVAQTAVSMMFVLEETFGVSIEKAIAQHWEKLIHKGYLGVES